MNDGLAPYVFAGGLIGSGIAFLLAIVLIVYFAKKAKTAPTFASAPCPRCQGTESRKVSYTMWGGALGPKLLNHVECVRCNQRFNGKTGADNTVGIAIYLGVSFVVSLVAVFAIVTMMNG